MTILAVIFLKRYCTIINKKTYGLFLKIGFTCLKAAEPLQKDELIFYYQVPQELLALIAKNFHSLKT